jgi:hypothetical protein
MNKIITLLLALLVSSTAYAQPAAIYQDPTAPVTLYTAAGARGPLAVDGRGYIILGAVGTGATDLGKAEDSVAGSGWTGVGVLGVAQENGAGISCAAGDFCPIGVSQYGAVNVGLDKNFRQNAAANAIKAEDEASNNGDAGIGVFGINNESLVSQSATNGDYVSFATDRAGSPLVSDIYNANLPSSFRTAKLEDSAAASGDALVGVAGVANNAFLNKAADGDYLAPSLLTTGTAVTLSAYDPVVGEELRTVTREDIASAPSDAITKVGLVTNNALANDVGSNKDYTQFKGDELGRTITTLAPAGESWSACSAANTGTSFVAIYNGLASNKFYVTSISCSNTATVASTISIRDGNGATLFGGGISNSTLQGVATWDQIFPVPLRASVVSASLGFVMGTTGTSTICCAAGYNSVN